MKNRYVISDIHGCYNTLKILLNKIKFSKSDELYFLGDYIDRGPNSKKVIDFIMELEDDNYNIVCLMGNHEHMLLEEVKNQVWPPGIPETLKSFGVDHNNQIPSKYINWLEKLPFYHEVDNFLLVHAGLSFNSKDPLIDKYDMLWVRDWYKHIDWNWLGNRIIIHGHTPIGSSEIIEMCDQLTNLQILNIDNGCVYNENGLKHLCCFNLDSKELIFELNQDKFYREK